MTTMLNRTSPATATTRRVVPPAAYWDGGAVTHRPARTSRVRTMPPARTVQPALPRNERRPRRGDEWKQLLVGGLFGSSLVVGLFFVNDDSAAPQSYPQHTSVVLQGAAAVK